ncbi:hypothetical protein SAMN05216303_106269 [Rhodoferax sp. OV413]|uniref:hypothetical protein n=1 Tax=Rhodoferax sp. OV413 TaxID=1855285 RepID=UPI000880441D|nr:hypothetical protein [Rhodoferax sp. OV413]SDP72297.1 hypothetical protein SAMN05216303_106269 [Rhodoferax sp. OV413]
MKTWIATFFIAACAISTCATGQNLVNPPASCPAVNTLSNAHLYGQWLAQIDGEPGPASVQFLKDPDQDDSLVGSINRALPVDPKAPKTPKGAAAKPALLAGDVQDGEFNLEESDDGVRISATWSGQLVAASCGKEIKGIWTNALNDQTHPFVLRRQGGWQ